MQVADDVVIAIIGANIRAYNHFESFSVPYPNGQPIEDEGDVTFEEFLQLTFNYYYSRDLCNLSYGDDAKEQNQTKTFIKGIASKYRDECIELGQDWCNSQSWKQK